MRLVSVKGMAYTWINRIIGDHNSLPLINIRLYEFITAKGLKIIKNQGTTVAAESESIRNALSLSVGREQNPGNSFFLSRTYKIDVMPTCNTHVWSCVRLGEPGLKFAALSAVLRAALEKIRNATRYLKQMRKTAWTARPEIKGSEQFAWHRALARFSGLPIL